ncbi:riboflavin synthase alpha chain [Halorientalis persicus]|uniref:Riboflavin synthase n=1 Tax=Halorientalis persicus TaxID=1367881 RepID=A0A1H8P0C6_9EURY|nr:riboflavin synthase [Halorientalis persicus]SEO35264.1 riboflavin synthase alpha chain [Halorientalis persicus]
MFTGIVERTGEITDVTDDEGGRRLTVAADLDDLHHGQSIAISGACLTVEEFGSDWFSLFLSEETLDRTYLGELTEGDLVNVERALPADGRFDGHVVQGHVDGTAEVTAVERIGDDWAFRFSIPEDMERYLVEKGSVTVDGISLTVATLSEADFGVAVIPATYDITTLSEKSVGDPVHLEVDVVAKYVERLLAADADLTASQTPYAERFED